MISHHVRSPNLFPSSHQLWLLILISFSIGQDLPGFHDCGSDRVDCLVLTARAVRAQVIISEGIANHVHLSEIILGHPIKPNHHSLTHNPAVHCFLCHHGADPQISGWQSCGGHVVDHWIGTRTTELPYVRLIDASGDASRRHSREDGGRTSPWSSPSL